MKIGFLTQSVSQIGNVNLRDFNYPEFDNISILKVRFYNPTQYNVKINGLTITPKNSFEMDLSGDFIQNNYAASGGLYPFYIEPINVTFPNNKGALDISVLYLFTPRTIVK